ncbi:subunit 17 of mediator complex protein [Rhizoctonia solani AG-3 Rhs1AP]|uniref:Mediator of RNA polymerase II transcription subunit 17 n=1 Tax=Rhizoctonia solani AG-3 Rhs1AP TaxID=1086054 RepID=X8J9A8_9AGAM|nr:subunit 17 of mediator complex protein [Rhizoctonia solani AG-3 Rhs1AP]
MTENYDPNSVKLSLEPPYRDDNGKPIPNLRDITQDGQLVFEEKQSSSAALGPQLKRLHELITARKREFRSITEARVLANGAGIVDTESTPGVLHKIEEPQDIIVDEDGQVETTGEEQASLSSTLNPETLNQLRRDMTQRLEEAQYSMNAALDMLNCLLAINKLSTNTTAPTAANPTAGIAGLGSASAVPTAPAPLTLAPSVIAPVPPQPSVAVMNAQIGITTRDAGIRKAAGILRHAALTTAEEIERAGRSGPLQGRHDTGYWATALRLRQACWALLPAALPPGSAPKGSSRTSKDILLGFALEGSPPPYRRLAYGIIPSTTHQPKNQTNEDKPPPLLLFPQLQNRRLRVSLRINGKKYSCPIDSQTGSPAPPGVRTGSTGQTLNNLMRDAQQEIVEHEIFQEVLAQARFAGILISQLSPTLIELDVTQDMSLLFERVAMDEEDLDEESTITNPSEPDVVTCMLIRQILVVLLARAHRGALLDGMSASSITPAASAPAALRKQVPILGPVVSLLRYRTMVQRVDFELKKILAGMGRAGIDATLTMKGVSEPGHTFVESLSRFLDTQGEAFQSTLHHRLDQTLALSGEALLRIEDKHLIQVTFQSPTLLKLHVVQSQITVHDHGQLGSFLRTDVAGRIIQHIQEIGKGFVKEPNKPDGATGEYNRSWFVDLIGGYCIGRWPGGKGRFQIEIQENGHIKCEATVESQKRQMVSQFEDAPRGTSLSTWVLSVMANSSHA